jgi:predicted GNAT family acetyltransferase
VAEAEGHIIASLLITYEWSDWRNATVWWIQSVYVIPAYRNIGVFTQMYQHIQQQAIQRRDVAGIRLYMVSENHTAGQVYQKMGMDGKKYRMFEWMK